MTGQPVRGISCEGLDATFEAEEARLGSLLQEAQMLPTLGRPDEAAERYAAAAPLEEHLAALCEERGLREKALVHQYGAARSWALAGNPLRAILLGQALLGRADLTDRLRDHIGAYVAALRVRRASWLAESLALDGGANRRPVGVARDSF